ncbi:metal ABC transporter solute-binding protein, Zn/Mn family [Pararhodobacter zhoushanensis]|uniref:Zinc ABC transporter substrate-binding protein n=1 Tax=Pararhodobacter zhoushanensis TaxID=2479545 RepID=A0ABT3GYG2_9RHOB|nr:zinc ABC transporter substrate-binding protein [Pararhodobacter zhoushanensis]MCW1932530.1 zinc ABC transporter substrate-binding protein [Pararhodobacter zhoushanensis]
MRKTLTALALLVASPAAAQPVLLATIGMIGDPAQRMAGDCVQVEVLIGPGLDPHLYQARPSDVALLRSADRIVSLGLGLEGRLGAILERVGAAVLGPSVEPERLLLHGDAPDPHIWMDPGLWATTFPALAEVLAELAPACAEQIAAGRDSEIARAEALDLWARDTLATIPEAQRVLLTAHDAFHYFSRAYGLENAAIQGISTESEASIADIDATAQLAADRQVPAAFIETTLNPRAVRALVEAAASKGHTLSIGGSLYSDALGEAGSGADTWPGMIVANVTTITEALGGTVLPLPASVLP